MAKKTVYVVGALALVAGAAALLWPRKASASPLLPSEKTPREGEPVQPKNAAEAYGLAMNPKLTNPDDVLALAQYLAREGSHPEWAAAAQKRYYDLKAELLLGEGLKSSTSLDRVEQIAKTLQSTHPAYAEVLAIRSIVQRGQRTAPAPFNLQLLSGAGSLAIDLAIYAPSSGGSGGAPPVGPTSPGATAPSVSPTAPIPAGNQPAAPASGTTPASGVPPLAGEETKPENDPYGTLKLCHVLLDEQSRPNWKYVSAAVKQWQAKVGLTQDGKFGPGSALRMAQEAAYLPTVRYWPASSPSKASAVNDYRGRLKALALSMPANRNEHAAALLIAADREQGQGWPATAPKASPISEFTPTQLQAALAALAAAKGGKK